MILVTALLDLYEKVNSSYSQNLHEFLGINSNESERRFFLANEIRHFQKK